MKLHLLNKEELAALYENEMTTDFPKAELKPLRAMLRLMDLGRYDPLLVAGFTASPGARGSWMYRSMWAGEKYPAYTPRWRASTLRSSVSGPR